MIPKSKTSGRLIARNPKPAMTLYLWLTDVGDITHDWFEAMDDEAAMEKARELTLPVFDGAHVDRMEFEIIDDDDRLVGVIEHRLLRDREA